MKKSLLALSITSALISSITLADEQATESIIITANRTAQNAADILSSVQVISRIDIEFSSASSVAELLSEVNGLQITQNGGAGQATSLFSRGTNSGHTLVVVDGQRISSATLGQVAFADLALEQIERIEVIKGPRAALWGSDAIGGVIQIFTRQLSAGEVVVELGLGNDRQRQATVSTAFAHGNGSTTVTASAKSSDGYDVFTETDDDKDGYSRENLSFIGQQQFNEAWQVKWLGKYNQGESEYDASFGANQSSFDTFQWQLSANQNLDNWYQEFFLGQQTNKSISFGNGTTEKDGGFFETQRTQASWLANYQFTEQLNSSFGVDLIKEEIDAKTSFLIKQRNIRSAFTQLAYNDDVIILDAAFRYDDIENVDSEITYNLSAGLKINNDSLMSLNIGTGFKAPSFNDLYYPNDGWSYGNPDLVAETSRSIELLVKSTIVGIDTNLSIYKTTIDNLIEWLPDVNFAYNPVNVNQAVIKGAELTLATELLGLQHQVQLGYLDARDKLSGDALIRRAKNTASYQVSQSWESLSLLANVNYQGKREDSEWPSTVTLPSHTTINVSASYKVNDDWELGLKVNNLLDKEYVTNNHYIGQPSQYLLTVSYRK